ncbi:MAG: dihydroorotase [Chlorobia bacterium]|nr:dihydroorotase [Fimbriimonadaceae bacterium]
MSFDLVIRNALITTSEHQEMGDLAVTEGKIASIGQVSGSGARELDAKGLTLIPGLIDTQVHFREPGMEHKEDLESGTRAAILGGVTSIFEMPNTNPTTTTAEALQDKLNRSNGRAWCDYSFFVGATTDNINELSQLENLPGSPGIKIFMGSSTGTLLVGDDDHLRQVLRHGRRRAPIHAEDEFRNRERKALISDHPHPREHPFLRDAESARLATQRILSLSQETGRPVHVLHVSTADELPLLAEAKRKELGTTCEVTPQHLWFYAPDCYDRLGTFAQMNPPIRTSEHQTALRQAVYEGLFDVFGSDHAPHTIEEKSQPYPQSPSGMPGVQTMLSALLTLAHQGLMDIQTIVRMACENPTRIYGIANKGFLKVGFDADLVLVDPKKQATFERSMVVSKCGWSPYEGAEFVGWPIHVFLGGQHIVSDQALVGHQSGRPIEFDWK